VSLERGPLSLVNTTEELLGRKNNGSGLQNREYGRGDPLLYQQKVGTNFTDKRRSDGRYNSLEDSGHANRNPYHFGNRLGLLVSRNYSLKSKIVFHTRATS
jgi:hypothetical protein